MKNLDTVLSPVFPKKYTLYFLHKKERYLGCYLCKSYMIFHCKYKNNLDLPVTYFERSDF